ncbi:MAG TPA: hypothetical protein VIL13_05765 [Longimicrobiales bacterium]
MEIVLPLVMGAVAVAAVLQPILWPRRPAPGLPPDDAALEAEVARYREALRAGTICRRCRYANPGGSRFCADCGRRLNPA